MSSLLCINMLGDKEQRLLPKKISVGRILLLFWMLLLYSLVAVTNAGFVHCPLHKQQMIKSPLKANNKKSSSRSSNRNNQDFRRRLVNNNNDLANNSRFGSRENYRNKIIARGGGAAASIASEDYGNDNRNGSSNSKRFQERAMAITLAMTYFTVMGAKCALPSVLSLLTLPEPIGLTFPSSSLSPNNINPQSFVAKLLTLSTLSIAIGKVVLGPIIDYLGGIQSLTVALSLLASLLGIISVSQSFMVFSVCWIMVDFIFSSCWAGCINAIHQSFPQNQWSSRIGILAAGARMGNAAAFALFASILHFIDHNPFYNLRVKQPWRIIFATSAVVQLVPIAMLYYFGNKQIGTTSPTRKTQEEKNTSTAATTKEGGKNTKQKEHQQEQARIATSLMTLKREFFCIEFWLHMISRSCLMVFGSFLLFVPKLMNQVYGASTSYSALTGSIYALGCLVSVTLGSNAYSLLSKKQKLWFLTFLLSNATISSLMQLGHCCGKFVMGAVMSSMTLFLWGFSFAIPFYIPGSLYALKKGGSKSSATIADAFDIFGFGLLALFNGYVGSISSTATNPTLWIPTFQITTACSFLSLLTLAWTTFKED